MINKNENIDHVAPPKEDQVHADIVVHSTKDYDKFILLMSNREVDDAHVRTLVREIIQQNLLHLNPILVGSNYEVIDGQHRLAAARLIGCPIFYRLDHSVAQRHIAGMNSIKKNWRIGDYINYFTANKVPDFIEFSKFCNRNRNYTVPTLLTLCGKAGKKDYTSLKQGEIDISNIEHAQVVLNNMADFSGIPDRIRQSTRFIEAIAFISLIEGYSHERMAKKIASHPSLIMPCINTKEYIKMLQQVYNRQVREENVLLFLKR